MLTSLFPQLYSAVIAAVIVALLLNATPPAVLLAQAATCTAASSPGGTFTDPTSTFVGCTITGWADFDFGSVVSTTVALSLFVSGSTVQLGQRLSIAGFAGPTTHQPLNATIVDSTFSNSALRIAGTFPSGTTITVLRTTFALLDVKLSVGQNTGGGGGYLNPNIFFSSVVLRDGSLFRVSQSTISNIKNAASTYNIVAIHVMASSDLTLSNQSSVVFSDTSIISRSQGADPSTYHVLVMRVYVQLDGRGNVVEFSRCNLTGYSDSGHVTSFLFTSVSATPGWADAPTIPAGCSTDVLEMPTSSGLLMLSQATTAVFRRFDAAGIRTTSTAFVVSGCRFNQYGAYNGFPTRFGFAPGTFALFEDNHAFGNRGTVFGIESQNLFSIEQVQNISVLMRRNTFDASANLMRQAVSVSGPTWQHLNLILYLNRVLLNNNGLLLLGTPSLPGGVTSTPITVHMIQNTVTGSATARPLLEGYTAPHETLVVCRNRCYGTMLAARAQYVSGTGVTDVPSAAGTALRYRCSTQTVDIPSQTRTLKITKTMSVSASPLSASNTHASSTSSNSVGGTTTSQTVTGTQGSAAQSRTVSTVKTVSGSASKTHPTTSASSSGTDSQLTHSFPRTRSHALTGATPPGNTPTRSGPLGTSLSHTANISVSRSPVPFKTSSQGPSSTVHAPGSLTRHTASLLIPPSTTHAADRSTTLSKSLPEAVSATPQVIRPATTPMTPTVEPTHSPLCPLLAEPATAHAWLAPSPEALDADTYQVVFKPPPTQEASTKMTTHQTVQWRTSDAATATTIAAQLPSGTALSTVLEGACALRDNRSPSISTDETVIICTVSGPFVRAALRAYPGHATSIQTTVVTGPCGRSLTLALLLQPPAEASAASLVVTVIVAAAVSTALFTAIVDPTAIDAQLITLVLLSACSFSEGSGASAVRVSRYLLSPLIDFGPATVALAHACAAVLFAVIHCLAALVTARRRCIPFQEACGRVHFPSVSFSVSSVLYAGAAWGTAGAIHNIQDPSGGTVLDGVAVVCAVCLLLLPEPVLCAFALLRTAARRHRFVMSVDTSTRARLSADGEATEVAALSDTRTHTSASTRQLLQWLCLPHGTWSQEGPFPGDIAPSSIRSLRGLAGPRAPLLHVVTRLQFLLCCALVTAPPRSGACTGRLPATAAILVASAVAYAVARPFRVHLITALSAALALATALLAAAIAFDSPTGLVNAAIVLASVCAVLRGADVAFVVAWEQCNPPTETSSDPTEMNPNNRGLLEMA